MSTTTMTTTRWGLDKAHSEIQFTAKHMMITTITGVFKDYEVSIETEDEDFTTAKITYSADVASIDTGNSQRDGHLRTNDFFNPEKFPKIIFESDGMTQVADRKFLINGMVTIRDITGPVALEATFEGKVVDPWGNTKYGFTVSGKLNRKDFGLNWNVITEAGGILVGEEIKIRASVQISKA